MVSSKQVHTASERFVQFAGIATFVLLMVSLPGQRTALAQHIEIGSSDGATMSIEHPEVQRVMKIQDSVTDLLMDMPGIIGVGTGLTPEGEPGILIMMEHLGSIGMIPDDIQGVPVIVHTTPRAVVLSEAETDVSSTDGSFGKTGGSTSIAAAPRPVGIGQSIGNAIDCSAGSIGVRVTDGLHYYVLSCNHVLSRTNGSTLNELALSPGPGDMSCTQILADSVGRLVDYEPLEFSTSASNIMDAAMARIDPTMILTSTPTGGYGTPSSTPATPAMMMAVKKYGKGTGLTTGYILAVNYTAYVSYNGLNTRFVDQLAVYGSNFVGGGDSGSMVVTDDGLNSPIGIVYAKSGMYGYVSPISPILARFGVSVDNSYPSPLPVELTSFSARTKERDVELKWTTATELNNFGFQVERSINNESWEPISFVQGAGTTNAPRNYAYTDAQVLDALGSTTLFYRLLQIDRDGTQEYSSTVEVSPAPTRMEMCVYPMPIHDHATVRLSQQHGGDESTLHVYDAAGRRLDHLTQAIASSNGMTHVPLSFSGEMPGQYFIEFTNGHDAVRQRIIVVR
ncbi:MAG: T9SS type A sorting domain-containing protein [Bacteroidota bacterium]|jgi:hypothetical protein|nr:T9SS type A sorting domain-containing protein [Bacteroidota bacterium]